MDKQTMINAIRHYKSQASPNNPDKTDLATIKDIEKIIKETADLMTTLVNQLNN